MLYRLIDIINDDAMFCLLCIQLEDSNNELNNKLKLTGTEKDEINQKLKELQKGKEVDPMLDPNPTLLVSLLERIGTLLSPHMCLNWYSDQQFLSS